MIILGKNFQFTLALTIIFFLLFILLYFFSPQKGPFVQSWDNIPTALLPITLLNEHNFDFNEFIEGKLKLTNNGSLQDRQYYFFVNKNSKVVANYPVLSGLIITPFYFLSSILNPVLLKSKTFYSYEIFQVNYLTSILITLITAFFIFLIVHDKIKSFFISIIGVFLFIFATPVINTTSRFVWQHTVALLFTTLVIYTFQKKHFFFTLFFSIIVFLSRPPALLLCLPFLVYLGMQELKKFDKAKIGAINIFLLICSFLLILFQFWYFCSYLDTKYFLAPQYSHNPSNSLGLQYSLSRFSGNIIIGFIGLIFSPSRGLLFFSPIFLFSLIELIKSIKKGHNLVYGLSFIIYVLLFAKSKWWYGGWTISYRYLIETLPILITFFCIYLKKISWGKTNLKLVLVLITIVLSIFFNTQINANYEDCGFNSQPTDIDYLNNREKTKRLFTDSPIFRCLSHFQAIN